MNARTFTTGPAAHRRRVTIRRGESIYGARWLVTIDRNRQPSLMLRYRTFDEACEDVRYLLALWAQLSAVRP